MKQKTECLAAALAALTLCAESVGASGPTSRSAQGLGRADRQAMTTEGKFYCNTKALGPEEQARHKRLSHKLTAARKAIAETEKGYEFRFSPQDVTIAELADWVMAESKCCPFFDFHIDLENQGKLICLRLTGEEGIKAFIRGEFAVN